jgi:putative transposase
MARLPRLSLAGHPHHVIQRGNDRQVIFRDTADFEFMLRLLAAYSEQEKVAVHSYVLMNNHLHLLATPESRDGLPKMMQGVGRRYVQYFNRRHRRTGSLWEGRYRAAPIESERYLVTCSVYIDLNPVRAGLVARPADYRWSSYAHLVGLRQDKLVRPHALYWQLGNTPFAREAAYAEMVSQGIPAGQQAIVTESALKGWVLGEEKFITDLQKLAPRRLRKAKPGRPSLKPRRARKQAPS